MSEEPHIFAMHLWALLEHWEEVVLHLTWQYIIPQTKSGEMHHKVFTLGLVLVKQYIALHWLSSKGPTVVNGVEMMEWAVVNELRLRTFRTDEKAEDYMWEWAAMIGNWIGNSAEEEE
ncbi:hypothetical protein NDU88_010214 [Pleurodeles waltl]|uniref:Uncharacterized protein n=1 Tax=Pleurodeles waltl TaxID=8319 RepID=A0AAV7PZE9_PLEWA|nr:hypothetical protein NDU88_010214 [Pleurodeles waltl]